MRWLGAILTLTSATAHAGDGIGVPDPGAIAYQPLEPLVAIVDRASDRIAIATSEPLDWIDARSLAVSLDVGLTRHQLLRFDVSSYSNAPDLAVQLLVAAASGGDAPDCGPVGRVFDVSASWVYFMPVAPFRLHFGPFVELGALYRHRNTGDCRGEAEDLIAWQTHEVAARVMVGWSQPIGAHAFVSIEAGGSIGYQLGAEQIEEIGGEVAVHVGHVSGDPEVFVRLGAIL
jgi:hypothetical protein